MKITRSDPERFVIVDFLPILTLLYLLIAGGLIAPAATVIWHGKALPREMIIAAGIGAVLALGVLAFTRRSVFSFNRANRQLEWSRVGFFGTRAGIIPFSQMKNAAVQSMSMNHEGTCYRISLILLEGEFPFTTSYNGGTERRYQTVCDAINDVLGKPREIVAGHEESDLRALIGSGRLIAAIARVRQSRKCSLAEAKNCVESLK